MNKIDYVLFHSPCFDGAAGCWVVEKYCTDNGLPVPKRYGYSPGKEKYEFPDMKGKNVVVVDICFDRETMVKMNEECAKFVVLDHHKTSETMMEGLEFAHFDMERSGCQLAWDYFFPLRERPKFIEFIADRDLWKWKLDGSKEFSNAIFNKYGSLGHDETVNAMWTLSDYKSEEYAKEIAYGKICDAFQQKQIAMACVQAIKRKMVCPDGSEYTVWVSDSRLHRSEIGNDLSKRDDCDFAVTYSYDLKNDEWWISLRSSSATKADVGRIASLFPKGGGHSCAAGFTLTKHITELLRSAE